MDMTDIKSEGRTRGTEGKAPTSAKKAIGTKKKGNFKPGPGRPVGSKKDKTGLTPNQKNIARKMLEAELSNGMFPATVREVVEVTGKPAPAIRALLKRSDFQKYLWSLLEDEQIILEPAFWRSMALGLQVGDQKVMALYAQITGKIQRREEKKVEVIITAPGGQPAVLPVYEGDAGEIVEGEVVE